MRSFFFYRKETPYLVGYVADFCPIEREITSCRIVAVHSSGYLNLIRISKGDFIRRDRQCCSCGIVIPGENAAYSSIVADEHSQGRDLEQKTNPGVFDRHRSLIELHRKIESGAAVDEELKKSLLKEQFFMLEQIAAQVWTSETKLDRFSVLTAILSFGIWFMSVVAVTQLTTESARLDAFGWVMGLALGLIILNAVVFFQAPRRAISKRVVPLLAIALRPLHPSESEIETILLQMSAGGFRYSAKVPAKRIIDEIRRLEGFRKGD